MAVAALVAGFGAADGYGKAQSGSRKHHRPPKLRAGEEWSFVVWELKTVKNRCTERFGVIGTQTCNGFYETNPFPRPEFGGWGFLGEHDGTSRAVHNKGEELMHVNFFTPGAEILGTIPFESSDRYTVTSSQGPGGWEIKSPADASDYGEKAPGEKGGPLHIKVEKTSEIERRYAFRVYGWVVVVKHARR
jgi:hypothetical protein